MLYNHIQQSLPISSKQTSWILEAIIVNRSVNVPWSLLHFLLDFWMSSQLEHQPCHRVPCQSQMIRMNARRSTRHLSSAHLSLRRIQVCHGTQPECFFMPNCLWFPKSNACSVVASEQDQQHIPYR